MRVSKFTELCVINNSQESKALCLNMSNKYNGERQKSEGFSASGRGNSRVIIKSLP